MTKKEWLIQLKKEKAYLKEYAKYVKALEKWIKRQKSGEVQTAESGGDRPPVKPPNP